MCQALCPGDCTDSRNHSQVEGIAHADPGSREESGQSGKVKERARGCSGGRASGMHGGGMGEAGGVGKGHPAPRCGRSCAAASVGGSHPLRLVTFSNMLTDRF